MFHTFQIFLPPPPKTFPGARWCDTMLPSILVRYARVLENTAVADKPKESALTNKSWNRPLRCWPMQQASVWNRPNRTVSIYISCCFRSAERLRGKVVCAMKIGLRRLNWGTRRIRVFCRRSKQILKQPSKTKVKECLGKWARKWTLKRKRTKRPKPTSTSFEQLLSCQTPIFGSACKLDMPMPRVSGHEECFCSLLCLWIVHRIGSPHLPLDVFGFGASAVLAFDNGTQVLAHAAQFLKAPRDSVQISREPRLGAREVNTDRKHRKTFLKVFSWNKKFAVLCQTGKQTCDAGKVQNQKEAKVNFLGLSSGIHFYTLCLKLYVCSNRHQKGTNVQEKTFCYSRTKLWLLTQKEQCNTQLQVNTLPQWLSVPRPPITATNGKPQFSACSHHVGLHRSRELFTEAMSQHRPRALLSVKAVQPSVLQKFEDGGGGCQPQQPQRWWQQWLAHSGRSAFSLN